MVYRILSLVLGLLITQYVGANGWTLTPSNTGLARVGLSCAGLPLYTGPMKPAAGSTISNVRITWEEFDLSNGNITLDRVCIQPTTAGGRASMVFGYNPDTGSNQLGPITIQDSDIDGSLIQAPPNNLVFANCAVRGAFNLYRNKIWGMGSGICYFGSPAQPTAVIEGNRIYGLRAGFYGNPPQQSHNSSVTIRGFTGTSLVLRNNWSESRSGADSGALFIQTFASNITNVTVTGNLLDTTGWQLPLEAGYGNTYSNMSATNNRFSPATGSFGAAYVSGGPGWAVWSNNYRYDPLAVDAKGTVVTCPGGACATGGNVSPTVSISAPANGTSILVGTPQTITATASDSDGTISAVVFKANGTTLCTDTASPYTCSWTPTSTGAVALTAEATDNGGAVTTSASVNVTVSAAAACSLDFNGDGTVNTTDALLFNRWLLGFRNVALVNGITPHPAGTTEVAFANAVANRMTLGVAHDFDNDTRVLAETDGLLLMRLTRGLTGAAVTSGAIGSGASRATHDAIRTHINNSCGTNFAAAPSGIAQLIYALDGI